MRKARVFVLGGALVVGAGLAFLIQVACCGTAEELPGERPAHWAIPLNGHAGLSNLHRVTEQLYRGAQPEEPGYPELARLGIRTVVNLRSAHSDREACAASGLRCVLIPTHAWDAEEEEVLSFLRLTLDPTRGPIFVHCQHGADRTGMMVAAYRVVVQGWSREEAIREMTRGGFGYHTIWKNLLGFIRELDAPRLRAKLGLPPGAGG